MTKSSDRAYLIVEGEAEVEVGSKMSHVQAGDAVYIPKGTPHSITGKVRYVIVNSPPFDPSNEMAL
jgi:mannose-6-phosphate isomerase-like protein (cupin superfamily)